MQATEPITEPITELPIGEYAALIGLDWGDQSHAFALLPRGATVPETGAVEQRPEALLPWLDALAARFAGQRVAFALEASKGPVVAALLERPWLTLYPIHPATSARLRCAFTPSGA